MAFTAGRDIKILVAEFDLTSFFNSADSAREADALDTTTFGKTSRTFIVGQKNGTVSLGGFWDGATDAIDEEFQATLGTAARQVFSMGTDGLTIGDKVDLLSILSTNYSIGSAFDGVSAVSASIQADGGIDNGIALHDLTAETATGNGTSVDNSASTANGGVGHLHVTAVTAVGGDTLDVKVQHSSDDAVWADLVTFTQVTTSKTSQRVVVAAGTTVNRYLRAQWTKGGGGSPSWTFAVSFARR